MKTTDLIPILLYHLKDGDKYGLELVEACSKCSNGKIVVKQPTLYSVLKKLEKSKFISSYWQDSDIGGKRHYFKITQNGLAQLETYPPLEDLVKMALVEEASNTQDEVVVINEVEEEKADVVPEKKGPSPFDNFSFATTSTPATSGSSVFDKVIFEQNNAEEVTDKSPILQENNEIIDEEIDEDAELDENLEENNTFEDETVELNENNSTVENVEENEEISEEVFTDENVIEENFKEENGIDLENTAEQIENEDTISPIQEKTETKVDSGFNIFDALDFGTSEEENIQDEQVEKIETPTPASNEIQLSNPFFKESKEKDLEEKTSLEINEENSKLLSKNSNVEEFATNSKISTFTQKTVLPTETSKIEVAKMFTDEVEVKATPTPHQDEIKYQDYIDIKNDKNIKKSLKVANIRLYKVLTTSFISLIALLACFFVTLKSGFTPIFGVFSITATLYVLYYACNFVGKFKEQHYILGQNFKYNFKKKFVFRICLFIVIALTLFIFNLFLDVKIFAYSNFGNFLAPLTISSLLLLDYLLSVVFYIKI